MECLTERKRIEILMIVGYGDRIRSNEEACDLVGRHYKKVTGLAIGSISEKGVSRLVSKYFATGTVKDVQRGGRTHVSEETNLNVLLEVQENPHCSTRQIGLNKNIDHSTIVKLLRKKKEGITPIRYTYCMN
ncbi:hypothetical protein NQ315_008920 [Exocentrus adspersus]|uniref:Uncharacterized protein n=1 Tax=Exocentrus adspersus TaxID=1586481 RepID=A0AAV8VC31_9CUCU|nr:hypothetical protein NQ315_008920 [Exocentrus adspersus]